MTTSTESTTESTKLETAARASARCTVAPALDVYENDTEWLIQADLPGVKSDQLNVEYDKNLLTISATRTPENVGRPLLRGAYHADFHRTLVIPRSIDADRISAKLDAGVLSIRLPKSDASTTRKIEVH